MNEILFLTLSAAISGVTEWDEIEEFGRYKLKWLRKFFPYKHGVPSHDTLSRFFAHLDPNAFCECFTQWMEKLRQKFDYEVIALDGKTVKGMNPKAKGMEAIYYVSAFATKNNLALSQKATSKKSNEIKAIPYLLDLIDCKGCIITADALNCQTGIAEKIIDKKADYLLAIKGNQGEIFEQIKNRFEKQDPHSVHVINELDHGRIEKRVCTLINDLRFIDDAPKWKKLKTIVKIESERIDKATGSCHTQTRYYISSLEANAELINKSVRSHWGIENQLHWHLDVTFKEDQSRKRKDHSSENFSIVLKTVLNLLKKANDKKPIKRRKLKALLDDNQRENFIFGL
jgi:predicted transposase YbfD/YdcC